MTFHELAYGACMSKAGVFEWLVLGAFVVGAMLWVALVLAMTERD